jgi:uncharacterized delta-60 repeat protein
MRAMTFREQSLDSAALGNLVPAGLAHRPRRAPRQHLVPVLLALTLVAARPAVVVGHPGDLDPSFGTGGLVTTAIGDIAEVNAVAVQEDGKIVVAGSSGAQGVFALARYNPDGSLDATFGTGGILTTRIGNDAEAHAFALQGDQKIVAAGFTPNCTYPNGSAFALSRYNPDGSLDATFGTGGPVTTVFGPIDDEAYAVAKQADGKLVAAGSRTLHHRNVFTVVRYLD